MKIGNRIPVHIKDASRVDPDIFSQTLLRIDGTIIKDLGKKWLVRLDATIAGKTYEIEIKK
ncbi:MAG: hypothetical protein ACFHWX_18410 [Bacteroidota bacterium]